MNRVALLLLGLELALPGLLSAGVDTAWVRRYDGPAHGGDMAEALAVDSAGNVYVTGRSASDTSGNAQYLDFVTIKYYPNGDTAWVRRADFGGKDIPSGLGVDAQGNVYVTGTNNDSRMVTVKYDSAGHLKWTKLYGNQICDDLALDQDGNVIICGGDVRASLDCVIVKYRPNGDTAWARFYDWAGYDDDLDALAPTLQGDICAVGFCSDTSPGGNILALRYDSTGNLKWAAYYDGPQHGADRPTGVVADRNGNSYIVGISDNGYGTPADYLTIKYDSVGETLWTRRYDGPASGTDEARAVAIDGSRSVCVTGRSEGEGNNYWDYATVKYDSSGTLLWSSLYDGPAHSADGARDLAVDASGYVYVTGSVAIEQSVGGCVTIKYSPDGDTIWVAKYVAPPAMPNYGSAIAVGTDGCVYVAGNHGNDIMTIKYVQNGGIEEKRTSPIAGLPSLAAEPSVFSSGTTVRFSTGEAVSTRVKVFDATGRLVRTLVDGEAAAGPNVVVWDGRDDTGQLVPAGEYKVVLTDRQTETSTKVIRLEQP